MTRVYVDMDGVIADTHLAWINILNERYGTTVTPEDVRGWTMGPYFPTLTSDQIYEPLYSDSLYETVPEIQGALGAIAYLRYQGLEVFIATSCVSASMVGQKNDWLVERGFVEPDSYGGLSRGLVSVRDKSVLSPGFLIDDGAHNLRGYRGTGILFDQPHNWNEIGPWARARDWNDVLNFMGV